MIEEKVKEVIAKQLGIGLETIVPEANFVKNLGADSLDLVELLMAFGEEFNMDIPDEDAEKITTVQEAVDYIRKANE